MKLAQALSERADLQKRIEQLKQRLLLNAKVQYGEKPAEEPERLLKELDEDMARLQELVARINMTNSAMGDGSSTLTELLARRDCLALKAAALRDFLCSASETVIRGTKTEIKIVSTVSVASLQKKEDALSKELRELDVKIQELNWTTELI